ncbi:hypothetical protein ACFFMR_08960 [Micromonospora andamanensis]|uniref:Integral membrane protein n=1 Tax=Micromonospora andamanensis TaxID=1287068 RepID=A0ABQ4HVV3_9ACTN|nr:hypothetical protein [Micromonospora andamanensis]GIJ09776.1 hypothetical protein Van01_29900 [Micromonospora andamanensis]
MSAGSAGPEDVVELRVHGVSAPAADQASQTPVQVAGDRSAGFYRSRPTCAETGPSGGTVEAYRWSDLPSGTMVRTLSLVFLLPFMLLNVAVWMRPGNPATDPVVRALCRVLGLTLTALYVLTTVGVALDLIAWQCMSSPACLSGRSWLSWLGGRPTGLRLATLTLVPVTAIGLIWWASTRPGRSFNAFRPPESTRSGHPLSAVGQWDAEPLMGRLRSIHVAAAFATLDGSLLAARVAHPQGPGPATVALAVLTGAVLTGCVVLICTPALIERDPANRRLDGIARTVRTIAIGLTIVVVVDVLAAPGWWPERGGLPGYSPTLTWLFGAHAGLLAALAAVLLWRRGRRSEHRASGALGALAAAAVGAGIAVAFSAELVHRVADLLDRGASPADRTTLRPPPVFTWAIYGFFRAVLITLVVTGLAVLLSRRGRTRAAAAILAHDFPNPSGEATARLRQVRQLVARARFTEWLPSLAVVYAGLAGLGAATTVIELIGEYPGDVIQRYASVPAGFVEFGIRFGSQLISATVLGLVIGGIFAYRTPGFRRHVGVLWDLATFWPRAAHPFAPPCYAERAVPELARRITYLAGSGRMVLVTGYSQGSVLVAATVLQLAPQVSDRVALLTYSSPLRRLYARLFPAYIDDDMLREVGDRLGWRWVNLWRDTDPIGGWVFSAHRPDAPPTVTGPPASVDRRLRDPDGLVAPPGDSVPPPVRGHGPGESDEPFLMAARELVDRLRDRRRNGPDDDSPPA